MVRILLTLSGKKMNPLNGFILYVSFCVIVAIVANKRQRSWAAFGGSSFAGGVCIVLILASAGGNSTVGGFAAFISPIVGLIASLAMKNGQQVALSEGKFGEYKKCHFALKLCVKKPLSAS